MPSQPVASDASTRAARKPVFNVQQLAARTGQQGGALRDFATLLLEHLPREQNTLHDALRDRDSTSIATSAHKLAGTFAALAIDALVTDALAIEVAADTGDLQHCAELAHALDERCEQVVDELARFVASFGPLDAARGQSDAR